MDKEFLHTKVIKEIISRIYSGLYRNGQRLPSERKLCDQFGISRGTLRSAFSGLEKMGVIKIKAQSGAYVQKFSHKKLSPKILPRNLKDVSLQDIIAARRAIELEAVKLACERITKRQLTVLKKLVDCMEESLDSLPDFLNMDVCFHESIVKASGNLVLIAAFEAIFEYHKYSQVLSSPYPESEKNAFVYHKKIMIALEEADSKAAVKILKEHFDNIETLSK